MAKEKQGKGYWKKDKGWAVERRVIGPPNEAAAGRKMWVGMFPTEEQAAHAADYTNWYLYREGYHKMNHNHINFPDLFPSIHSHLPSELKPLVDLHSLLLPENKAIFLKSCVEYVNQVAPRSDHSDTPSQESSDNDNDNAKIAQGIMKKRDQHARRDNPAPGANMASRMEHDHGGSQGIKKKQDQHASRDPGALHAIKATSMKQKDHGTTQAGIMKKEGQHHMRDPSVSKTNQAIAMKEKEHGTKKKQDQHARREPDALHANKATPMKEKDHGISQAGIMKKEDQHARRDPSALHASKATPMKEKDYGISQAGIMKKEGKHAMRDPSVPKTNQAITMKEKEHGIIKNQDQYATSKKRVTDANKGTMMRQDHGMAQGNIIRKQEQQYARKDTRAIDVNHTTPMKQDHVVAQGNITKKDQDARKDIRPTHAANKATLLSQNHGSAKGTIKKQDLVARKDKEKTIERNRNNEEKERNKMKGDGASKKRSQEEEASSSSKKRQRQDHEERASIKKMEADIRGGKEVKSLVCDAKKREIVKGGRGREVQEPTHDFKGHSPRLRDHRETSRSTLAKENPLKRKKLVLYSSSDEEFESPLVDPNKRNKHPSNPRDHPSKKARKGDAQPPSLNQETLKGPLNKNLNVKNPLGIEKNMKPKRDQSHSSARISKKESLKLKTSKRSYSEEIPSSDQAIVIGGTGAIRNRRSSDSKELDLALGLTVGDLDTDNILGDELLDKELRDASLEEQDQLALMESIDNEVDVDDWLKDIPDDDSVPFIENVDHIRWPDSDSDFHSDD
ncbi:hypothetical protein GOP47_0009100 [Adiantum capillus-veneris]|uniref:AP2/ERF domain-containing protein n=1 Tax=Adiantum capillus-veneris TaxID=13818 RepID=A0A9D4ZLC3_ADICA|nr:hypothetical protein GOP47_0009100 [Adiantum capillus-veneris]